MLPGDGVATRPAFRVTNTMSAQIPPAHMARIMIGWDRTYGKEISWIPAEKLLASISKPDGMLSAVSSSNFLIRKPPTGPTIIAPRNIGTLEPTMIPAVTTAPTTPPRWPYTSLPPVYPRSIGRRYVIIGPTSAANVLF